MANKEQLSILKQGVEVWNKWREENPGIDVDLTEAKPNVALNEADLHGVNLNAAHLGGAFLLRADLSGSLLRGTDLSEARLSEANITRADLRGADLSKANLRWADLSGAYLRRANLSEADLSGTNLTEADLREVHLIGAKLREADLREAALSGADLSRADLCKANLMGADLTNANLRGCNLIGSHISNAVAGYTIFGDLDLSQAIGLGDLRHTAPSSVSTDTLALSKGKIPGVFLQGCGLRDADIESAKLSNPDLSNEDINKILYKIYDLRASQAIQISPLFISYAHTDSKFVDKLGDLFTKRGIRFWRDVHNAVAGRLEKQIDRAIRQNPTVLLILSSNAIQSDWVEHEVRTARELEKELGRDTLCPVALDDSWKSSPWPKRVMEQIMEYNILDFSEWKDDIRFNGMFRKLIDGLRLFYKG